MTLTDLSPTEAGELARAIEADVPRKAAKQGIGLDPRVAGVAALIGAAFAGALFALTPLSGSLGMVLVWALTTCIGTYFLAKKQLGGEAAKDAVATILFSFCAVLVVGPLLLIVGYVATKALPNLRPGFFTQTLEGLDPDAPADTGGAAHAIVGTLVQVAIATIVSLPFGVLTALYLNEIGGRMAGVVRTIVDAMSGIPSVVAGLFIYSIWVVQGGFGYSGLAAGLALAVLMLPTVTRATEEMLKLVPGGLRESALALGAPEWRVALRVVLPTAKAGIVTAVILGIARVAGETAPLLMTAFGNDSVNFARSGTEAQSALPLFVYQQVTSAQGAAFDRAWVGAFVLISLVLVLFILARLVGRSTAAK